MVKEDFRLQPKTSQNYSGTAVSSHDFQYSMVAKATSKGSAIGKVMQVAHSSHDSKEDGGFLEWRYPKMDGL